MAPRRASLALTAIYALAVYNCISASSAEAVCDEPACLDDDESALLSTKRCVSKHGASATGTPVKKPLQRIHVISSGRQGSSFMLELVERAGKGLPVVFEPLRGMLEGSMLMSKRLLALKKKQISCLYSENASGCKGSINEKSLSKLKETLAISDHPPVVLKTTRIVNLTLLAETLSPEQEQGTRFLVMVRDPRAVWASFKPFKNWAIHSMPLVCELLAESLLTAPALAKAAPGHVTFAVYERWSKDLVLWSKELAEFVGQDGSEMTTFASEHQQPAAAPKWIADLTDGEVSEVEHDPNCAAYMDRVGYKRGKASGADYSGLRSTEELRQDLDRKEKDVLASLGGGQRGASFLALRHRKPLFASRSGSFEFRSRR